MKLLAVSSDEIQNNMIRSKKKTKLVLLLHCDSLYIKWPIEIWFNKETKWSHRQISIKNDKISTFKTTQFPLKKNQTIIKTQLITHKTTNPNNVLTYNQRCAIIQLRVNNKPRYRHRILRWHFNFGKIGVTVWLVSLYRHLSCRRGVI